MRVLGLLTFPLVLLGLLWVMERVERSLAVHDQAGDRESAAASAPPSRRQLQVERLNGD